jgi:predicted transglutaminase-like cysteine proteinase
VENLFEGYSQFPAPADDEAFAKWRALQPTLRASNPDGLLFLDWLDIVDFNRRINRRIIWQEPDANDDWQTPEQTLALGHGDCMDFAILKYATILSAGADSENLGIVIGEIAAMPDNLPHAWVCVQLGDERRVLDSKFDELIEPREYINWQPKKLLVGDSCFLFGQQIVLAEHHF